MIVMGPSSSAEAVAVSMMASEGVFVDGVAISASRLDDARDNKAVVVDLATLPTYIYMYGELGIPNLCDM